MTLSPSTVRDLALQGIPGEDRRQAFGTYCMSRPDMHAHADDRSHILNKWFRVEKREALLGSCAALLCRDSEGELMVLSAPRLMVDNAKPNQEDDTVVIAAQNGNSLHGLDVVSLPFEVLHQSVVGFLPSNAHPAMDHTKFLAADDVDLGPDVTAPIYQDQSAFIATLPSVIPLEFGHGIDCNLSCKCIQDMLASRHPYYALWIESTNWLCDHFMGRSLHQNVKLPATTPMREALTSSVLLSYQVHNVGSLAAKELQPDLDRVRDSNLEAWLENNPKYYQGIDPIKSSPPVEMDADAAQTLNQAADTLLGDTLDSCLGNQEEKTPLLPNAMDTDSSAQGAADKWLGNDQKYFPDTDLALKQVETHAASISENDEWFGKNDCDYYYNGITEQVHPLIRSKAVLDVASSPLAATKPTIENVASKCEVVPNSLKKRSADLPSAPDIEAAKKRKALGKVENKIFKAMAELRGLSIDEPHRSMVALFAGYLNHNSKGFKDALKKLTLEGYVQNAKRGALKLTNDGIEYMPQVDPPETNAEVHDRILRVLQKKVERPEKLRLLWRTISDGEEHEITSVAESVGYTNVQSSGFKSIVSVLVDFELMEKTSKKKLRLKESVFPFGRASQMMVSL